MREDWQTRRSTLDPGLASLALRHRAQRDQPEGERYPFADRPTVAGTWAGLAGLAASAAVVIGLLVRLFG